MPHVGGIEHATDGPRSIAVLLPCANEELTVAKVVRDFLRALPGAHVFVYDNASSDATGVRAMEAGATVRYVATRGKGNVLRRMFAEVDADVYVLADGDDTYDAESAPRLIETLIEGSFDMVIGRRVEGNASVDTYRRGHRIGNLLLTRSVDLLFGGGPQDMLSGYRVFSRRFVKSFPALSTGFETEAEMTVHALDLMVPICEVPTSYRSRPPNSVSKLRTIPDGLRILRSIVGLWKQFRPMRLFAFLALLALLGSIATALFATFHVIPWWTPSPVTVVGLVSISIACLTIGVVLDSIGRSSRETKRLLYLAVGGANSERPGMAWHKQHNDAFGVITLAPNSRSSID